MLNCTTCLFKTINTFEFIDHTEIHPAINVNNLKKRSDQCPLCKKEMINYYKYIRHKNNCPEKKQFKLIKSMINNINHIDHMKEIRDMMDMRIRELENNNEKTNEIIEKSININNLGSETTIMLNKSIINRIFSIIGNIVLDLKYILEIEKIDNLFTFLFNKIFINEKYVENHCIYITDKNRKRPFYIFKDDKWTKTGNLQTLRDLVIKINTIFLQYLETTIKDIVENNNDKNRYMKYKEVITYNLNLFFDKKTNRKLMNKICYSIYDLFYNNKSVIKETFGKSQKNLYVSSITNDLKDKPKDKLKQESIPSCLPKKRLNLKKRN
tara:strand:- start:895 stop:1869 length:975 start_codon:yes stop_codon:yes gene_type:complete